MMMGDDDDIITMGQIQESAEFCTQPLNVGHTQFPVSSLVQERCVLHPMGLAM